MSDIIQTQEIEILTKKLQIKELELNKREEEIIKCENRIKHLLKVILVCHTSEIVYSILNDPFKEECIILFVGNNELNSELMNNERIIVARHLQHNIEKYNYLLTFTAWYAIVKNELFSEYKYICILEYDVSLDSYFFDSLLGACMKNKWDIISFLFFNWGFNIDINEQIFKYFINKKQDEYHYLNDWYPTTNQCVTYSILKDFVDWFFPDCLIIKKLHPLKISWYHERVFSHFICNRNYKIKKIDGLHHGFANSHENFNKNKWVFPDGLLELYFKNDTCEFLNKLIDNYELFIKLNNGMIENCGSYLIEGSEYNYCSQKYKKQLLLFENAKNAKTLVSIGNYLTHVIFIALLANPKLTITCIEKINEDYTLSIKILEMYFNTKINYIKNEDVDEDVEFLKKQNPFDLVHISQQYPIREDIIKYLNAVNTNTNTKPVKIIIDDWEVYPNNMINSYFENISKFQVYQNKNTNCENSNKLFEVQSTKKYMLLYDDESGVYSNHINKLIHSIKQFSDFEIIVFTKSQINKDKQFIKDNADILNQSRGGGYWLWKPYIIHKTLQKLNENDILFYIDSTYYFTEEFSELYRNVNKQNILIWKNKPNEESYLFKNWCKMDIILKHNLYKEVFIKNMEICWAGAIVLQKNNTITNLINNWFTICCCKDITDSPSEVTNSYDFIDHRHDQSLLSIVLHKYNIQLQLFENRYLQNVRRPY